MNKKNGFVAVVVTVLIGIIALVLVILGMMTFSLDWTTGEHGRLTITAVDKNLFGTYTVYVRNSESLSGNELQEVRYCIDADNKELADFAKGAVGKQNTKLVYPDRRIGFFWLDKCSSSPVKEIILAETN